MFRIVIPTLLLLIQLILYIRTRDWLSRKFPERKWLIWWASALFLIMNIAFLYVAIMRPRPSEMDPLFLYLAAYPFFVWHGATLFIGLFVLISILIKAPFLGLRFLAKKIPLTRRTIETVTQQPSYQKFNSSRRTFLRHSMYGLTGFSFGATAYGMFIEKAQHEIVETLFPIRNLPPGLNGFTIALISDIHSSINMLKEDMDEYVRIVNSLQCDMILVTGDFVNSLTEEVYPFVEAFSNLQAPHGVYGVMGNHDFFAPKPEIVAREIDDCGVKLLRNDKVLVRKNGGSMYLLGVDDVRNARHAEESIAKAIGYAPLPIPKLLMIHRPYFLQQAADKNIDLVFSGHTHGGQVVLARFGRATIAPASLASRFIWGKYRIGNTSMYVNRGIGTVGLPIRFNCPPEITRITLIPEPSTV